MTPGFITTLRVITVKVKPVIQFLKDNILAFGPDVGPAVGLEVGPDVGPPVGAAVGLPVGPKVGASVASGSGGKSPTVRVGSSQVQPTPSITK